ncbi:DEKNAAC103952 [Brettanomyces naardenensis]|uniref:DEKNAAC103952 n=1 Tax=Brettanomyces naardenensis TaxID=13370 RepID=A0A448YPN6_BRENA|nr:DEKNAAC103952 [Brettanomyces naardenensis]
MEDVISELSGGHIDGVQTRFPLVSAISSVTPRRIILSDDDDDDDFVRQGGRRRQRELDRKPRKRKFKDSKFMNTEQDAISGREFLSRAKVVLSEAMKAILEGSEGPTLPRSLITLQGLSEAVSSDKEYAAAFYALGDKVFNDQLLPRFAASILSVRGKEVDTFVNLFDMWNLRVWNLKLVFLILDNSPTFRTTDSRRKMEPYWMLRFGKSLFESAKEISLDSAIFDPDESKTRNRILLNFCDLVEEFLSLPPLQEQQLQAITLSLKCFFEVLGKLKAYHALLGEENKVMTPILERCMGKVCTDLRDRWISIGTEKYLKNVQVVYERIESLRHILNRHNEVNYDLFIGAAISPLLNTSKAQVEILERAFDEPEKYPTELKFVYEQYDSENWDMDVLSDMFSKSLEVSLHELLVKQIADPKNVRGPSCPPLIRAVLNLWRPFISLLKSGFNSNREFSKKISKASERVVWELDNCANLVAEALLQYIYGLLMDKWRGMSKEQKVEALSSGSTEDSLKSILTSETYMIFGMIPDRKRFLFDRYKMMLGRRLLHNRFIKPLESKEDKFDALEAEKYVLNCLRSHFGRDYLEGMYGMIDDVVESNVTLGKFTHEADSPIELAICCVNEYNWKEPPESQPVIIPKVLQPLAEQFKARILMQGPVKFDWKLFLHRVTIDIHFGPGSTQAVECSIYQAAILLSFEDSEVLSFEQLLTTTGMERPFLAAHLKVLTRANFDLLLTANGDYKINSLYKSSKRIVRLPTHISGGRKRREDAAFKRTGTERDEKEMLSMRLQAFITRTLKGSGPMKHDKLMVEVLKHLAEESVAFTETLRDSSIQNHFKKILGGLINDGFIARHGDDAYRYLP